VQSLFDLEYTGRLEKTLSDISKGEVSKEAFMGTIIHFTTEAVEKIKLDAFHIIGEESTSHKPIADSLGKCPGCGSDVVEGEKGFGCSNWKGGCKFVVWKNDKFLSSLKVTPNRNTVIKLLEVGEVYSNNFINKKGSKFSAYLSYEKDAATGYYRWNMRF
jgi:DNA topoisomerase-3